MFNTQGQITETTIANVAVRRKNGVDEPWLTPSEQCGLLAGVKRQVMIEKGELQESVITLDELVSYWYSWSSYLGGELTDLCILVGFWGMGYDLL